MVSSTEVTALWHGVLGAASDLVGRRHGASSPSGRRLVAQAAQPWRRRSGARRWHGPPLGAAWALAHQDQAADRDRTKGTAYRASQAARRAMAASARRWWRLRGRSGSLGGTACASGERDKRGPADVGRWPIGGRGRAVGRGCRGSASGSCGRAAMAAARRRWRRASRALHRPAVLALDPAAVAQERAQRLHARGLGGLPLGLVGDLAGGEQVGQHLRLQPVGADLAPHGADGGHGGLVLVQVARATRRPATWPRGSRNSAGSSSGRRKKVRAAQAVADAVRGRRGPCRRRWRGRRSGAVQARGSDWAGEGVAGMAQAPGLDPASLSRKRAPASRNLRLSLRPPPLQQHAWRRHGRRPAAPRAGLRLDNESVLLLVESADTSLAVGCSPKSPLRGVALRSGKPWLPLGAE